MRSGRFFAKCHSNNSATPRRPAAGEAASAGFAADNPRNGKSEWVRSLRYRVRQASYGINRMAGSCLGYGKVAASHGWRTKERSGNAQVSQEGPWRSGVLEKTTSNRRVRYEPLHAGVMGDAGNIAKHST